MKLRNKKTGEIIESACIGVFKHKSSGDCERVDTEARSLEKVLEEWEDYTPAEPLIKDEKIRKAVRAWAEAVGGSTVCFYDGTDYGGVGRLKIYQQGYPAVFDLGHQFYDLEPNMQYTITELCGEEDE